jgi:arginine:ornithine antiporter/lysine permease
MSVEITNMENIKNGEQEKVGLLSLLIISISSTIGAGIFNIPQNIATETYAGYSIIIWIFTAIAIYFILLVYVNLSKLKPKESIYDHAKQLFGPNIGYLVGFGYYISSLLTICCFGVTIGEGMNYFFPDVFNKDHKYYSILLTSVISWIYFVLYYNGLNKILILNTIATFCKIIVIIFYICALLITIDIDTLKKDFWGNDKFLDVIKHLKNAFIICIFCYLGIETSTTLSNKSKSEKLVSKAINISYVIVSILYLLPSFLSYGVLTKDELSKLTTPSMAGVLEKKLKAFGKYFINCGMLISVLSCWLSHNVNLVEMFDKFIIDECVPKFFLKKNNHNISIYSLLFGNILIQICLIVFPYLSDDVYLFVVNLSTVFKMPCYLTSSIYLIKLSWNQNKKNIVFGCLGILITILSLLSFEIKYILFDFVFFLLGCGLYIYGNSDYGKSLTKQDIIITILIAILSIIGIIYMCVK